MNPINRLHAENDSLRDDLKRAVSELFDARADLATTKARLRQALEAVEEADREFRLFTSNEQRVFRGPEGQTVGSESYRLNYYGRQKAPIFDALLKAVAALDAPAADTPAEATVRKP